MSRAIDADALEKEGWSLHRTIQVDKNTMEYQTKPLKQVPTIEPEQIGDPDRVYSELSKVYNMKGLPDEVYSIIGDLMISLPDAPERKKGYWTNVRISVTGDSEAECNLCGAIVHSNFSSNINYCPNCGDRKKGKWILQDG